MPEISLAMIVRNEEQTLARTIESVRDHVSEIVIGIDLKSTDGTRQIAERLADVVFETRLTDELAMKGPISGDPSADWGFSKARNDVFDRCRPNAWRLILDGHETVLDPAALAPAVEAAMAAGCDGVEVQVWFEPQADGIPQSVFSSQRLAAPSVRYVNPIHNALLVKKAFAAPHIRIEHRKRDQAPVAKLARDQQRSAANIGGLKAETEKQPTNARAWFYLGTAYRENARPSDAIGAFEECLKHSRWHEERWHARVEAARCLIALGRVDEGRAQFSQALDEQPVRAEAYYYLGDLAYKQQRFHEAMLWLEACVAMPLPSVRLFLNPRIYLVERHDLLSMVYHHLRMPLKAAAQAALALTAAPNARIEKNMALWRAAAGG